jgi:hypothetical protein
VVAKERGEAWWWDGVDFDIFRQSWILIFGIYSVHTVRPLNGHIGRIVQKNVNRAKKQNIGRHPIMLRYSPRNVAVVDVAVAARSQGDPLLHLRATRSHFFSPRARWSVISLAAPPL